jgi:hypothetical protein
MNWEYISGFFDADGCITLTSNSSGKNKTIQMSFHNNELNILKEIKNFIYTELNVKGHISLKKAKKDNHNDSYDLKYVYQNALKVANMLNLKHPKKKRKIEIYNLIQEKTKRNGKYSEQEKLERTNLEILFFQHI